MKPSRSITRWILCLLPIPAVCRASGYMGDLAQAWADASIVVVGQPIPVDRGPQALESGQERFTLVLEKAYKGATTGASIEFLDARARSSAALNIQRGLKYLVFVRTADDRKKAPGLGSDGLGNALSCLRAYKVDAGTTAEIEAGLATIQTWETLPPQEQKAFLLQQVEVPNAYSHPLVVREILKARVKEAIPYFQQRLGLATNESDKLDLVADLRILGAPDTKDTLLAWLNDDSFKQKAQLIEELVQCGDGAVLPAIRKHIDDADVLVAVAARTALLRLGDPEGKRLCLDLLQSDAAPTARYNAIHCLNWNFSGDFTDPEKSIIRQLNQDKDPSIARVARFIMDKWKSTANPKP